MSALRDQILDSSLALLNQKGMDNVGQRDIAEDLNISLGNLTYHFPKKRDIHLALYERYLDEMTRYAQVATDEKIDLFILEQAIVDLFELLYAHRFMVFDLVPFLRNNPDLSEHYIAYTKQRRSMFLNMVDQLILNDIMQEEQQKYQYSTLHNLLFIFCANYLSTIEIFNIPLLDARRKFRQHILYSFYPYLSETGLEQYKTIMKEI